MAAEARSELSLVGALLEFLLQYAFFIVPSALLVSALYSRYALPLRNYPGPLLASFTRLWKIIDIRTGRTNLNSIELHHKYGPFVRIAPREISVGSAKAAAEVLAPGRGFTKSDFYSVFPPFECKDIFTELDEKKHAQKKRVAGVPYTLNSMLDMSPSIKKTIGHLLQKMDGFAETKGEMDLGRWLHFLSIDVLGEVAFSANFGFLEAGYDLEGTLGLINNAARYCTTVGQAPILHKFLLGNPVWEFANRLLAWSSKINIVAAKAVEQVTMRKPFEDQKLNGEGRKDILNQLILGHLKTPEAFSGQDILAVAMGAIFAGADSTSSTMQSFFWQVLKHPETHKQLVAEIAEAESKGLFRESVISYAEAQQLEYFQAVLKEAMRLRPGLGVNMFRNVPSSGVIIEGIRFPAGTVLALNPWSLHRDKTVFGNDADVFRPERWLEDAEKAKWMNKYLFQFGGGSHMCLGRNLSMVEMNHVLPQILRRYDIELANPNRDLRMETTFFVIQTGLDINIRRRVATTV